MPGRSVHLTDDSDGEGESFFSVVADDGGRATITVRDDFEFGPRDLLDMAGELIGFAAFMVDAGVTDDE